MPKIILRAQIRLESQMVISMYHLMSQDILKHALLVHPVGANHNPVLVVKSSQLSGFASSTTDIMRSNVPTKLPDVVAHISDNGRKFQKVVSLIFASLAVHFTVSLICVLPVLFLSFWRHLAGGHAIEILESSREGFAGNEVGGSWECSCRRSLGLCRVRHNE